MKRIIVTVAAIAALAPFASAQFAKDVPLSIGQRFQHSIGTSGRQFSTLGIPFKDTDYSIPFIDFNTNYGLLIGSELDSNGFQLEGMAYGLGAWATRDVGGDGLFVGLGAHVLMSDIRKTDFGGTFVIGWRSR